MNDNSWVYYSLNKEPKIINNLIKDNEIITNDFISFTSLDKSLFKTVILINNDCLLKINEYNNSNSNNNSYIMKLNSISKFLKEMENSKIEDIDQNGILKTCLDLNKLNIENKKND